MGNDMGVIATPGTPDQNPNAELCLMRQGRGGGNTRLLTGGRASRKLSRALERVHCPHPAPQRTVETAGWPGGADCHQQPAEKREEAGKRPQRVAPMSLAQHEGKT